MEIEHKVLSKINEDLAQIKASLSALATTRSNEWLTTVQVSERYHLSIRTIANLRKRKAIPYSQIGTKILYRSNDLESFMSKHVIAKKGV